MEGVGDDGNVETTAIHVCLIFDSNDWDNALVVLKALAVHEPGVVVVHAFAPAGRHQELTDEAESWDVPSIVVRTYDHAMCDVAEILRSHTAAERHVSALCKMHLADLLPHTVPQVLYLDNNVLPVQSIEPCWLSLRAFGANQMIGMAVDMGGECQQFPDTCWPVAYDWAVPDGLVCGEEPSLVDRYHGSSWGGKPRRMEAAARGPLCPQAGERELYHFNSGVVLMDLGKMRAFGFVSRYVQHAYDTYASLHDRLAVWGEQCFINSFFRSHDVLHELACGCNYQWAGSRRRSKCSSEAVYIGHGWREGTSLPSTNIPLSFQKEYLIFRDHLRSHCVGRARQSALAGDSHEPGCPPVANSSSPLHLLSEPTSAAGSTASPPRRTVHCPHQSHPVCRPEMTSRPFGGDTVHVVTRALGKPLLFATMRASVASQAYSGHLRHVVGGDEASFGYISVHKSIDLRDVFLLPVLPQTEAVVPPVARRVAMGHAAGQKMETRNDWDDGCGDSGAVLGMHRQALQSTITSGWVVHVDEGHAFQGDSAVQQMISVVQTEDDLVLWKTRTTMFETRPSQSNFFSRLVRGDVEASGFMFHSKHLPLTAWGNASCGGTFPTIYSLARSLNVRWVNRILTRKTLDAGGAVVGSPMATLPTEVMLTVVIMGYEPTRGQWLAEAVQQYCGPAYKSLVAKVIVLWNNLEHSPPVFGHQGDPCVQLRLPSENSLNNRWMLTLDLVPTAAVLVMDDDILLRPAGMSCMLEHWKGSLSQIVGPFVRVEAHIRGQYRYVLDELLDGQPYSMVLPRVAVVSREVLKLYASPTHAKIRQYVDDQAAHCDDIALNALVGNNTGVPPLRVLLPPGTIVDHYGGGRLKNRRKSPGLASQAGRQKLREECLQWILGQYRSNPLSQTRQVGVCDISLGEIFIVDGSEVPRKEYEKGVGMNACKGKGRQCNNPE